MPGFLILIIIFLPMYQESNSNSWGRVVNQSGVKRELQKRISVNNTPRHRQSPNKHSSNTSPNENDILNYLTSLDYFPKEHLRKLVQVSSTTVSPETPKSNKNQVKDYLFKNLFPNEIRYPSRSIPRTSSIPSEIILMPDEVEYKVSKEMLLKRLKCNNICTSLFTNTCNMRELFSHCKHVNNKYKSGATKERGQCNANQSSLLDRQCKAFKYLTYTLLIIVLSLSITLVYIFIRMRKTEYKITNHWESKKKYLRIPTNYNAPSLEYMNVTLPLSLLRKSTARLYDVPACPARPISTINTNYEPEANHAGLYNNYEDMCDVPSRNKAKIEGTHRAGNSEKYLSMRNKRDDCNRDSEGYELMSPLLDNDNYAHKSKSSVDSIYELVSSAEKKEENRDHYEIVTIKGHNKAIETNNITLHDLSLIGEPVDGSGSESSPQVTEETSGIYEDIHPKCMKLPKDEEESRK